MHWLLIAVVLALVAGCHEPPAQRDVATSDTGTPAPPAVQVRLRGEAMGTHVTLLAYTTDLRDEISVAELLRRALAEIERLEKLMTTWRRDSEVSQINANAGVERVMVSPETFAVIAKSTWISTLSGGVFDITFASMGKLWRFDDDVTGDVPDAAVVERERAKIDYRNVELDHEARAVRLKNRDTAIALGGIAKGYAIDRAADILRTGGLVAFYLQAGGDLYVEGRKPGGEAWKVGIRDPRGPKSSFFARVPVDNHAFSTAGDYERAFVRDGKRYHHIIDPRTGFPATASRSVTIWAKDALTADAIDDAVFILGPIEGLRLVEKIPGCGAVIVDADNRVHVSRRLEGMVEILQLPSAGI